VTYLSRIRLNPQRAQARRFLSDPQVLHAAVLAGIPRQPVSERVLWRLDADEPLRPHLLVLTASAPSWEHLVEQAGWPSADDPEDPQVLVRPYETLLDRLQAGQRYVFRLRANPVTATKDPKRLTAAQRNKLENGEATRSRRVAHRTVEHQMGWLLERTARLGFSIPAASSTEAMQEAVPDVRIIDRSRLQFSKRGSKGRITIQTVTFEGHLVIEDVERFREVLTDGVGRAKAYGCGLLTLAPAGEPVER